MAWEGRNEEMAERIKAGLDRDEEHRRGPALSYDEIAAIYGDQDVDTRQTQSTEEVGSEEARQREPGGSGAEANHEGQAGDTGDLQQEDGRRPEQDHGEEASEATA